MRSWCRTVVELVEIPALLFWIALLVWFSGWTNFHHSAGVLSPLLRVILELNCLLCGYAIAKNLIRGWKSNAWLGTLASAILLFPMMGPTPFTIRASESALYTSIPLISTSLLNARLGAGSLSAALVACAAVLGLCNAYALRVSMVAALETVDLVAVICLLCISIKQRRLDDAMPRGES